MTDPEVLVRTRRSLHAVAEQVLAAALHAATGRIGLRATPDGFGTPVFAGPEGDRRLLVEGTDLIVERAGSRRRHALTTVRDAAAFADVEPGAPAEVYPPATPVELDQPLAVDPEAATQLARFLATVADALDQLCADHAAEGPATVQLWPEHFDLATTISEVNLGGSPGDADHPLPYLYVGPWQLPADGDPFWNEPFGASLTADDELTAARALAFFEEGRARLAR